MDKIKIFVVDDSVETRGLVKRYIEFNESFEVVGEAGSGEETLEKLRLIKPDIVLMDINMPNGNGLETTEEISKKYPEVIVVIMSVQKEAEYLKKAMLSGAREYIIKPFNLEILNNTIMSAYDKSKDRIKNFDSSKTKEEINGEIIAFYSSKGGVGKSILASNYGLLLSKLQDEKVIIVDFDLLFGDIALLFDIKSRVNVFTLVEEGDDISMNNIYRNIYHYSDNLDILLSPSSPEFAETIKGKNIENIILELKKNYQHIIIDLSTDFNETTIMSLDLADYINYISTPDLLSVKNTKIGMEVLNSLNYKDEKVRLVINQSNVYKSLEAADIKKILNRSIYFSVPYDQKAVNESILTGQMIGEESKIIKSKVYKAIEKFMKMDKE